MVNRPSILVTVDYYLPGYKGGGPIRTLSNMVDRLGDEFLFKIVTRDRDIGDYKGYHGITADSWLRWGKAEVYYLSPKSISLTAIQKLINSVQFDVLYLNSFFSSPFTIKPLILYRLGQIPQVPVILAPRGELASSALVIKKHKKRLYMTAAKLLCLYKVAVWQASSIHEERDIKCFCGQKDRVVVAPDLTPLSCKQYKRCSIKRAGSLEVVFLSRIARVKNLKYALSVLRDIKGEINFNIYGPMEDDDYWEECESLIKNMPMNIKVIYWGPISNDKVSEVLSKNHLLFLPTYGENFGHVIIEALMAGCPVLISDQTPWKGLDKIGAGWDLPLNNPVRFRDILEYCVEMNENDYCAISDRALAYGLSVAQNSCSLEKNRKLFLDVLNMVDL